MVTKKGLDADLALIDDLVVYGTEASLAALLDAAPSLKDDPREFARDYVDGLPQYRS